MFIRSLALGAVSVALLSSTSVLAADLIIPTTPQPIVASAGFDWEGLYVGARAGGQFTTDVATGTYGVSDSSTTYGVIGAAAGVNFIPVDPILLGVEVTADYLWGGTVVESTGEFFANLRVGAVVTDAALIYAIGGVGLQVQGGASEGVYQLGGGVEFAVSDAVTVRGEIVGQGDFDNTAPDAFFETAKATVGVFYHF